MEHHRLTIPESFYLTLECFQHVEASRIRKSVGTVAFYILQRTIRYDRVALISRIFLPAIITHVIIGVDKEKEIVKSMKNVRIIIFLAAVLLIITNTSFAHKPVIVKNQSSRENPILVEEPEISWAFYGVLEGEPHYYKIVWEKPFTLYVNILVPDLNPEGEPVPVHDMSFAIVEDDTLLHITEGIHFQWRRFYEEYGRDHYYMGPEFEKRVDAGTYYVRVFNGNNSGRYSLAIGKIEKFNFFSLIGAILKAKSLDRWFFR